MSIWGRILIVPLMMLSYALKILPLTWLGFLGRRLGDFLQLIGFRTRVVRGNLQLALGHEKSPQEIKELLTKVYHHTGTLFLEIARNFSLTSQEYVSEVEISPEDFATLEKIKKEGKGLLVISAHVGNWEIFPAAIAGRGFGVAIVAKKMSSLVAQTLIEKRRIATGFDVIYTGNTLQNIAESMKKGNFVGCMLDQHMPGPKGLRVNFFGVPAASIRGIAKLHRETRCPVYAIFVYRQKSGKHCLKILEQLPYIEASELTLNSPERIEREEFLNTQRYQESMEKIIRCNLEQWLWIHRRWKTERSPVQVPYEKPTGMNANIKA